MSRYQLLDHVVPRPTIYSSILAHNQLLYLSCQYRMVPSNKNPPGILLFSLIMQFILCYLQNIVHDATEKARTLLPYADLFSYL